MESIEVIPRPPAQKWRDARQYIPVVVFILSVFSISRIWREHVIPHAYADRTAVAIQSSDSTRDGKLVRAERLQERVFHFFAIFSHNLASSVVTQDQKR
jgi:hypothetical protein